MKISANEFILPFKDGWECHASHILPFGDGRVYCVFFYGSKEGNPDVRIFGSMRSADGKWSDAAAISENDGIAHWNPVLFRRKDGAVILFYKVGKTISDWVTKCRISTDECKSWSDSFEMVEGDISGGRGPVRNKAIYLSDGSIIAPGSTEKGEWKCFFDRSTDGGATWKRSRDLCIPLNDMKENEHRGIIQPSLWESESGVHALMRSTEGKIYRTDSANGIDWCDPYPTDIPNNNSGIDTVRLPDKRIILACNPVSGNWAARTPISLFVSCDDGKTFSLYSHLTTMQGKYAYPALQYENGRLHVSYTWNRRTLQYFCLEDI